jgi:hypothetical protein
MKTWGIYGPCRVPRDPSIYGPRRNSSPLDVDGGTSAIYNLCRHRRHRRAPLYVEGEVGAIYGHGRGRHRRAPPPVEVNGVTIRGHGRNRAHGRTRAHARVWDQGQDWASRDGSCDLEYYIQVCGEQASRRERGRPIQTSQE